MRGCLIRACSRLDYTGVWLMQDFRAVVRCCLLESTVKRLDGGKFLWNVNSSSTHSSSWLLSFPLQREHTPHTFHPQSHPPPPPPPPPTLCQPQSPLSPILVLITQVLICLPAWQVRVSSCVELGESGGRKRGATALLSAQTRALLSCYDRD